MPEREDTRPIKVEVRILQSDSATCWCWTICHLISVKASSCV